MFGLCRPPFRTSPCSCSGGVGEGAGVVAEKKLKMIENSVSDPVQVVHILDKSATVMFLLLDSG